MPLGTMYFSILYDELLLLFLLVPLSCGEVRVDGTHYKNRKDRYERVATDNSADIAHQSDVLKTKLHHICEVSNAKYAFIFDVQQ